MCRQQTSHIMKKITYAFTKHRNKLHIQKYKNILQQIPHFMFLCRAVEINNELNKI
jgi:hypothetical protein